MSAKLGNFFKKFPVLFGRARVKRERATSIKGLHTADDYESLLRAELLSSEQLEHHAQALSIQHKVVSRVWLRSFRRKELLLPRLKENERIIDQTYELVNQMVRDGARMPPAAEWLLDNYYVIKEHIGLAHEHLPPSFSRELPVLTGGSAGGLPRIYHLATELIAHADGRVDIGNLSSFVSSYQREASLTLGELWALPIVLRLALIENLRRVGQRIRMARADCVQAALWGQRLIATASSDPKNLVLVLAEMARAELPSSSSFIAEACRCLQGRNAALALALNWFEHHLSEHGLSVEQVILAVSQEQMADYVSIGNTINSLRVLGVEDWREFVERHSAMERILREDPAGVYPRMSFKTRDMYRHVVEKLSKRCEQPECAVARRVVEMAQAESAGPMATKGRAAHIGYYLIDRGLVLLEQQFRCYIHTPRVSAQRGQGWRLGAYLFGLATLTALLTALFGYALMLAGTPDRTTAVLSALFAFCASQTALRLCNALVSQFVSPQRLPQLDFSKGIPEDCRAVVAVATMFVSRGCVDRLIAGLEIRYLANRDANLYFALLTDFTDADQETLPGDLELVEYARRCVRGLNAKYALDRPGIFYLLHRPRRWNASENKWMGHERKRGKLAEFNRVLRGTGLERFMACEGDLATLTSIKYAIPLDTDTLLPANSAQRLVGAMAHVLNQPVYDSKLGRVVSGYGILQPRVSMNLSHARISWFVRIFARDAGVDPYTREVSDVYQDLFGQGSFVGKGIYDVDVFERSCSHFPENRILSHDLIEGCYARSGLLSDVELFEDYPSRFNADARRRHRWMRGDWQIASWLLPSPPCVRRRVELKLEANR